LYALIDKNAQTFIQQVSEGSGWLVLPNGDQVSGFSEGWESGTYKLVSIAPATGTIPEDKIAANQTVTIALTESGWTAQYVLELADKPRPTSAEVNAERDRRIASGFKFSGKSYAMDNESKARIIGAATLAGFAVASGKQAGDYRWANADSDFVWIADDNTLTPMDAPTCFAFGQAAAAWETSCIFAGRAIKESSPVPYDYTADTYWP
jgi:hypothetical protein